MKVWPAVVRLVVALGIGAGLSVFAAHAAARTSNLLPEPFDPGYMRALFAYGLEKARHGYVWVKQPLG